MAAEATRRVQLTRVYHFSAAHCLGNPALSAADNATLYGPCSRPHGHNYYLEVTVAGVPDPLTGFAVDLVALFVIYKWRQVRRETAIGFPGIPLDEQNPARDGAAPTKPVTD